MSASYHDEVFKKFLRTSKEIVSRMVDGSDKEICSRWINRLVKVDTSNSIEAKKGRNEFFSYFIDVMRESLEENVLNSPYSVDLTEKQRAKIKEEIMMLGKKKNHREALLLDKVLGERGPDFQSYWSKDRRTYVAVKPLPGRGAIIYMAVSKDPKLGWEFPNIEVVKKMKTKVAKHPTPEPRPPTPTEMISQFMRNQ